MTETYSLLKNFPNGLLNHQLQKEINDDENILKNCIEVRTEEDNVKIVFESKLTTKERTQLDTIVNKHEIVEEPSIVETDFFDIRNPDLLYKQVILNNVSFPSNTSKQLEKWTHSDGLLEGFNLSTGIFKVPVKGLYCFGITSLVQTYGFNNNIFMRIFNNVDNSTRFASTMELNNLAPEAPGGAATLCGTNMVNVDEELKFEVKFSQSETCNFVLRIIRIFG